MHWIIPIAVDLAAGASPLLYGSPISPMYPGDANAHQLAVSVYSSGVEASLVGCTVYGYFGRADGNIVPVRGEVEGNTAIVTFSEACYAVPGALHVIVRLTDSETPAITIAEAAFRVSDDLGSSYVDPDGAFPTLSALADRVKELETVSGDTVNAVAANTASIAQIVAGTTPSDSELVNIRVGVDGETYTSAGLAVRTQINGLVAVDNDQPADTLHRIWVQPSTREYIVPEMTDVMQLGVRGSGSGVTAKIDGTLALPLVGLVLHGKSTQDGTPALDAPVDIVSPGGSGTLRVCTAGRNLLTGMKRDRVHQGVTFAAADGGGISVSGTASASYNAFSDTSADAIVLASGGYPILPPGSYVMPATGDANINVVLEVLKTSDLTRIGTAYVASENTGISVTTTEPAWFFVRVRVDMGVAAEGTVYPAIYLASDTPESFEAFAGSDAGIPVAGGLNAIPVTSGGNYTDAGGQQWLCDTIDYAAKKLIRRVYKVVLVGADTESYGKGTSGSNWRFTISMGDKKAPTMNASTNTNLTQMSSHFTFTRNAGNTYSTIGTFISYNTGTLYFRPAASITTVTELKTWLAAQNTAGTPVTFVYPLAAAIEESLTDAQIGELQRLRSVEGVTRVWCADGSAPELAADCMLDAKTYIDNAIAAALS